MKDVATAYDGSLGDPNSEPEMKLSEDTQSETNVKIKAEEKKADLLQAGIDTDVGADGTDNTIISSIPTKDKYNTKVTMAESLFDRRLKAKKEAIAVDLARLKQKYLTPVTANISAASDKQKEITFYDTLISPAKRSARSYLASLKASRRRKPAGKKSTEST
jgi:hypothetical protein